MYVRYIEVCPSTIPPGYVLSLTFEMRQTPMSGFQLVAPARFQSLLLRFTRGVPRYVGIYQLSGA